MKPLILAISATLFFAMPVLAQEADPNAPPVPATQYAPADPAYDNWYKIVSDSDDAAAAGFNKAGEQRDAKDTTGMCASLRGVQATIATEVDALNHMTIIIKGDSTITPEQFTYESYIIDSTRESVGKARDIADSAVADNCKAA